MRQLQAIALAIFLLEAEQLATAARFIPLGGLNGGNAYSEALAVSADGNTVVGAIVTGPSEVEAFRWTRETGMETLGDLPGADTFAKAHAVSNDGKVIIGLGTSRYYVHVDGFRWTLSSGMSSLGYLPSVGFQFSYPLGISGDGRTIVGGSRSDNGNEAFRWTADQGMQGLGDLPGGPFESYGNAISNDGKVIVGASRSEFALEAFRWTVEGGMQGLGFLPNDLNENQAWAVSADGAVIIGSGGRNGWRWTESMGLVSIGRLTEFGDRSATVPQALTADGSIIVGSVRPDSEVELAFIWDQQHGVRKLQEVVQTEFGIKLKGWTLTHAQGISDNGAVIVGRAINPQGQYEAFVLNLLIPEPTSLMLQMTALMICVFVHRDCRVTT